MKKLAITLILTYLVAIMISGQGNPNSQNTTSEIKFLVALDDVNELINLKTEPFQIDYEKTFRDSDVESLLLKKVYSITCLNCKKMNVNNPTEQIHPLDEQNLIALFHKEVKSLVYIEHDVEPEPLWDAPNDYDTTSSLNWHIQKEHLNFIEAWEQILPTDIDVKVAVMDWDLDFDHPDMCANLDTHNGLPALYKGYPTDGVFTPNPNDFYCIHNYYYDGDPECGFQGEWLSPCGSGSTHGNMVVSMIGAEANNGIGITGLAYNKAKISFYQLNGTSIYLALIDAANKGVSVFNMSFATGMNFGGYSETFQEVINEAYSKGMLIVAAAGNFGLNGTNHENLSAIEHVFPASYNNVLSVTLTGNDETGMYNDVDLINSVTYNNTVDIAAGGLHTARLDYEVWGEIRIAPSSGTSAAAPTATSLAALIKSVNPLLNNKQIEYIMKLTATDIYDDTNGIIINSVTKKHNGLGNGLIDAGKAVQIARNFNPSEEVPYCLITKNRRASISLSSSNKSVEIEGVSEGGLVTWSHDGLGTLIYPNNNPNSLSVIYRSTPNDFSEVVVTMTTTKSDSGKSVTYKSFSYITVNEGTSQYSFQRYFCDNKSGIPVTLEVKELNMDDDYRYKEYEYFWELSNTNAGTITSNGRIVTFTKNPDFKGTYYITAWAWPYKVIGNMTDPNNFTVLDNSAYKRRLMYFYPISSQLSFSEIKDSCSMRIGVNEVDGIEYSWSPQDGLSDPFSANTLASPETLTKYTLICTSKLCGTELATFEFEVNPKFYEQRLIIVKNDEIWNRNNVSSKILKNSIRDGIVVKNGATLTIKDAIIKFGPDEQFLNHYPQDFVVTKGIVVEEGGKLILENVTLTIQDNCDNLFWGGIEIRATNTKKGELIMKNSIIEYANTAILFGKKYYEYWTSEEKIYNGSALGKIEGSTFKNNKDNIVFQKSGRVFTDRALVKGNTFISNFNVSGFEPKQFITLNESDGVLITENTFVDEKIVPFSTKFSAKEFSVKAIYSFNSNIRITKNTFQRVLEGINVYALNGSRTAIINDNNFKFVYKAITLQGVPYAEVTENTILCYNPSEYDSQREWINNMWVEYPSYGIFSASSPGTNISENKLSAIRDNTQSGLQNISRGIVIQNSGNALTEVYNNTIEGFGVGLETQYDNPNLYFYCNQFINNNNGVFLNVGTPGLLAHQSSTCEQALKKPTLSLAYFPNNEFITDEDVTNIFSDIYADTLIYAPDGTLARYYDNPNTPNHPELIASIVEYSSCDSLINTPNKYTLPNCDEVERPSKYKNDVYADSDILRDYLKSNNLDEYIIYLEELNTDFSNKQLVSVYFELDMKDKAQEKLKLLSKEKDKLFVDLYDELLSSSN